MSEYIVDFGDKRSNRFVRLNMALIEDNGAKLGERVIRCRDCKFCHKNYCEKRVSPTVSPSEIYWIPVEPDGFCAWGERRSE